MLRAAAAQQRMVLLDPLYFSCGFDGDIKKNQTPALNTVHVVLKPPYAGGTI
jgi:hypothetical protein